MVPLALTACGGGGSGGSDSSGTTKPTTDSSKPSSGSKASGAVTIKGFAFGPDAVEVSVGDAVTWTNDDSSTHTATAEGADGFDTGDIKAGTSKELTFDKAGTYDYHCSIHDNMTGTVRVLK